MTEIINKLLKAIHTYYPIGLPNTYKEYEGYKELQKIIRSKIDSIVNNDKNSWHQLIFELSKEFKGHTINDFGYLQFSSYNLQVKLFDESNNLFDYSQFISVDISLLANYYTIYFEDFARIKNIISDDGKFPFYYNVVYLNSIRNKGKLELISLLMKKIESFFKEYKYVYHKTLHDYKLVGGTIYGNSPSPNEEFSIYQYLFNNSTLKKEVFI